MNLKDSIDLYCWLSIVLFSLMGGYIVADIFLKKDSKRRKFWIILSMIGVFVLVSYGFNYCVKKNDEAIRQQVEQELKQLRKEHGLPDK